MFASLQLSFCVISNMYMKPMYVCSFQCQSIVWYEGHSFQLQKIDIAKVLKGGKVIVVVL